MTNSNAYAYLKSRTEYAMREHDRELMYQTYGEVRMAYSLGAISDVQFYEFNTKLVRDGINNPRSYDREDTL